MRLAIATILAAATAVTMAVASADAQGVGGAGGGGGGRKQHHQKTDKNAAQKPKVDEKAYSAALKAIPDKQYDPWHGVRDGK